jgi:uncharacterized protein DUF3276
MSSATVSAPGSKAASQEHEILFQKWFKSVGPRTYAAQLKKARNGNHYLALTEGRRDEATGEVRKTRLFIYSEDFIEFFKMLHEAAVFVREHPVSPEVKKRQELHWAKQADASKESAKSAADALPKESRPVGKESTTHPGSAAGFKLSTPPQPRNSPKNPASSAHP